MTQTTATLADFLLARIAEDEAVAKVVMQPDERHPWGDRTLSPVSVEKIPGEVRGYLGGSWGEHFARWDPARVLGECEAKREIVRQFTMIQLLDEWHLAGPAEGAYVKAQTILQVLAAVYRDHPDYREEWRP